MKQFNWPILATPVLLAGLLLTGCSLPPFAGLGGGESQDTSLSTGSASGNGVVSETVPPEPPEVRWAVAPWLDCEEILPVDSPNYANMPEFLSLSFFKQNGQYGLVNQSGKIIVSPEQNASFCFACGLVDDLHFGLKADGSQMSEIVGHSGGGTWVYELNREQVVYYGEYNVLFGPESFFDYWNGALFQTLVPIVRINGDYSLTSQDNFEGDVSLAEENGARYRLVHFDTAATVGGAYQQVRGSSECSGVGSFSQLSYLEAPDFAVADSFTASQKSGEWYFYNSRGEQLPFGPYEDAKPFHSGFAAVKQDGLWAYIDETGILLTPFAFEDAASGYNGAAWAKQDGRWGVVTVLASSNATARESASNVVGDSRRIVITAEGGLRLRSLPSSSGEILTLIPTGTTVEVLESENGWLKVTYENQAGWVSSQYTAPAT